MKDLLLLRGDDKEALPLAATSSSPAVMRSALQVEANAILIRSARQQQGLGWLLLARAVVATAVLVYARCAHAWR